MPETDSDNQSRSIAAVERAMDVLLLFGRSGRPDLGVTEIATELGITKAAVHRILTALRSRDLIVLEPTTRRYALGHAAIALGRAYLARTDLRVMAAPELRRLSAVTGETATLSIRRGDTRMYADQVVPDQELRMEVALGQPYPLYAGSSSKAILAFLRKEEIDEYLARHELTPLTDATITKVRRLRADLKEVKERGYAISLGERQIGAASIAAPVFDHDGGVMASISVCGPLSRFEPRMMDCVPMLLKASGALSAQLGYSG
ncbi:IclR family transcriptional regulator [Nocardia sp. CDC159]|uniref:IclR family transcriptional regulator n=1 Tax=Nocardia pulmonis TaxID=2951408 RepID=A0A9X2E1L1_9NOCA|nr:MULTISPECIES: IclR family transcriptional regulator [Nocardia]MCM6771936.1 IclR family transcriptional regulator [Nocardia pulmonis]MCM6785406.1 IclR family transcriptional regulator [Nocardia sp. CDC159]